MVYRFIKKLYEFSKVINLVWVVFTFIKIILSLSFFLSFLIFL